MKICIPVNEDKGLQSPVCAHFGSAPLFLIVDTDDDSCRAINNASQPHAHGMCQPLAAFANEPIDGLIVGGIGMGAVQKLRAANVRVFICQLPTVQEALAALRAGALAEATPQTACQHHGHGPHGHGGHGHGPHGHGGGCGHN